MYPALPPNFSSSEESDSPPESSSTSSEDGRSDAELEETDRLPRATKRRQIYRGRRARGKTSTPHRDPSNFPPPAAYAWQVEA